MMMGGSLQAMDLVLFVRHGTFYNLFDVDADVGLRVGLNISGKRDANMWKVTVHMHASMCNGGGEGSVEGVWPHACIGGGEGSVEGCACLRRSRCVPPSLRINPQLQLQ